MNEIYIKIMNPDNIASDFFYQQLEKINHGRHGRQIGERSMYVDKPEDVDSQIHIFNLCQIHRIQMIDQGWEWWLWDWGLDSNGELENIDEIRFRLGIY